MTRLLILLLVLCAAPAVRAQACPTVFSPTSSGDSGFSSGPLGPYVTAAVQSASTRQWLFLGPWGVQDQASWHQDASGTPCSAGYASELCASRLLLNAAVLADHVPKDGNAGALGTWRYWSDLAIADMDFDPVCSPRACSNPTTGYMDITRNGIFSQPLLARAGTIMHEAQHIASGRRHCDDAIVGSICYCAQRVSCDPSWAFDGANRAKAEFITQALQTPGLGIPDFARLEAIDIANRILNEGFSRHPGFILDSPTTSSPPAYQFWDLASADVQLAFFDDSIRGTPAIHRVETSLGLTSPFPSVTQLSVQAQLLTFLDRKNSRLQPFSTSQSPSLATGVPATPEVVLAGDPGNPLAGPKALVSLELRSSGTDFVAARAGFRLIRDGIAVAPTEFVSHPPGASGPWALSITAPSGTFISGFGLGASLSTGSLVASADFSLGPELERLSGGTGGTARVLKCPVAQVPIGIHTKSVFNSLYGSHTVGYFGIVCTDRVPWLATGAYQNLRLVRGSFTDTDGSSFSPGTFDYIGANHPAGVSTAWCPQSSMIRGMRAMAGAEVDRIYELYCSTPVGGPVPVNVGGSGGVSNVQDCWNSPGPVLTPNLYAYAPFVFTRSGARLDAIAVGCHSSVDYLANFESGATDDFLELDSGSGRWSFATGPTPSNGTGPSGPLQGTRYAFVEATGASEGTIARLESHVVDLRHDAAPNIQLTWSYHMFGAGMGTLRVEVQRATGTPVLVSEIIGNRGDTWHSHPPVSLEQFRGERIRIRFVGIVGPSYTSDFAIDAVRLRSF